MSLLKEVQTLAKKTVPVIKTGFTVKVHQKIKEGEKERVQIFEGLVIALNSGHGADKTFTVRKVVEGIGVEKIFPLYSTNIAKIEVTKKAKVRRAKLYYMRKRSGKSARLKETQVGRAGVEMEEVLLPVEETPVVENAVEEVTEETAQEQTPEPASEEEEVAPEQAPAGEEKAKADKE